MYTHVLGLKSRRERTAFTQTHDCLYRLMDWLEEARKRGAPTVAEAEEAFEGIWQAEGPGDHAFASDYRELSSRLIDVLVEAGSGLSFLERGPLPVHLGGKPRGRGA